MDRELLDDGVRQQLGRELGHPVSCDRLGQLNLEPLALAHTSDLAEAEAPAGAGDGLTLRVVDLRLQHHIDDESGHIPNSTRARSINAGRDPGRRAVALNQATMTRFVTCVTIGTLGHAALDRSGRGDSTVAPSWTDDRTVRASSRPDMRMQGVARGRQRCRTRRPPGRRQSGYSPRARTTGGPG